ncbi:hypothetical protein [Streptomyces sp. FIT100]|uniref:hypothetical protein n=1 Tax=Streptomyces sp. FIT100 TaxID=2837956 RepID=UPI0021C9C4B3|nr:hypothetical protein [Streptomyces sp. FIT100]UUN29412.1 hypothetical protein KK483_25820 [Streptomyces sp. FIT100]
MQFARSRSVRGPAAALAVLTLGAALVAAPSASAQPQVHVCSLNEFEMRIDSDGNATGSASGSCQTPLQSDIRRATVEMEGTGSSTALTATSNTHDTWTFWDGNNNPVATVVADERRDYTGPNGTVLETGSAGLLSGEPFTGCTEAEVGTATRSAANNAITIQRIDNVVPNLDVGFNCEE